MTKETNKPIETIRFGRIAASIWQNNGDNGTFYSFTLERTYTDDKDKPQSTGSFNLSDALVVSKLANLAHTRIHKLMVADKVAANVDEADA